MDSPEGVWAEISKSRGYRLPSHMCPDGSMPILKPIVSRSGDIVALSARGISVNGVELPRSAPLPRDKAGRPLEHYPYGVYRVWLVSTYSPNSFDSRYFGPVAEVRIKARLNPFLP